jgi:hypothetical protein
VQCGGDFTQHRKRQVSLATFDATDVTPVDFAGVGKVLLSHIQRFPGNANTLP